MLKYNTESHFSNLWPGCVTFNSHGQPPTTQQLKGLWIRTLKAAIMCHADRHWTESLTLVLLGIRAAFKEDMQASVVELVHDEPL